MIEPYFLRLLRELQVRASAVQRQLEKTMSDFDLLTQAVSDPWIERFNAFFLLHPGS